jgi:hypothetical protein
MAQSVERKGFNVAKFAAWKPTFIYFCAELIER